MVLVLLAALGQWVMLSSWSDIVVGAHICAVFLRSAFLVGREARAESGPYLSRPSAQADEQRGGKATGRSPWTAGRLVITVRVPIESVLDFG